MLAAVDGGASPAGSDRVGLGLFTIVCLGMWPVFPVVYAWAAVVDARARFMERPWLRVVPALIAIGWPLWFYLVIASPATYWLSREMGCVVVVLAPSLLLAWTVWVGLASRAAAGGVALAGVGATVMAVGPGPAALLAAPVWVAVASGACWRTACGRGARGCGARRDGASGAGMT